LCACASGPPAIHALCPCSLSPPSSPALPPSLASPSTPPPPLRHHSNVPSIELAMHAPSPETGQRLGRQGRHRMVRGCAGPPHLCASLHATIPPSCAGYAPCSLPLSLPARSSCSCRLSLLLVAITCAASSLDRRILFCNACAAPTPTSTSASAPAKDAPREHRALPTAASTRNLHHPAATYTIHPTAALQPEAPSPKAHTTNLKP
jgi:hypothetical protein